MDTLNYTFSDKDALASACMGFIIRGGLFLAVNKAYALGESMNIVVQLWDETEPLVFMAKVIWLTPIHEGDQWPQGVGIQFGEEDSKWVRARIETYVEEAFSVKPDKMAFFA